MYGIYIISLFLLITSVSCNLDVFGSKTAYDWAVDTQNLVTADDQDMSATFEGKTCKAIYVNAIIRHGVRYPSDGDMEDMTKLQERIIDNKASNVFNFIDTWNNTYPLEDEKQLVEIGRKEMSDIGERFARRFATLFRNYHNTKKIQYVSSSKDRAIESAEKFYEGFTKVLTGQLTSSQVNYTVNNSLVRFYDDCNYYEEVIEDSPVVFKQFHDFMKTSIFTNMKTQIEERLGFQNITLETDELALMYEMCAFERSIYNRTEWCDFLKDSDRKIMEYRADLEDYYEKSYGNDISGPLACTMVEHMFNTMDEAISSYSSADTEMYAKAHFKFGHSESVMPLYTALGLFRDNSDLLATNMATMVNRTFRSSHISPLGANLAFVLYACPGVENSATNTYAVKLLVNEQEIVIPKCGKTMCAYHEVKEAYKSSYEDCNKDALCQYPRPTTGSSLVHSQLYLILLAAIFSFVNQG